MLKEPIGITIEFGIKDDGKLGFNIGKCQNVDMRASYINNEGKRTPFQGGVRIDFKIGKIGGPMPKLYKWKFYKAFCPDFFERETETNPFNSGNFWFEWWNIIVPAIYIYLSFPMMFLVYPFKNLREAWRYWQPGFYLGFKGFKVDKDSSGLLNYKAMKESQERARKKLPYLNEQWYWDNNIGDIQNWKKPEDPVWQFYIMYGAQHDFPVNDGANIKYTHLTDEQKEYLNERFPRIFEIIKYPKLNSNLDYIPTWGKKIQGHYLMIPTGSLRSHMIDHGLM